MFTTVHASENDTYVVIPCIFHVYSRYILCPFSLSLFPRVEPCSASLLNHFQVCLQEAPERCKKSNQSTICHHASLTTSTSNCNILQYTAIVSASNMSCQYARKAGGNHEATRHNLITIRSQRVTVQVCKLRLLLAQDLANGLPNLPSWIGSDAFSQVSVCIRSEAGA